MSLSLIAALSAPAQAQVELQGPNFGQRKNDELSVEEQYELGLKYLKRGYYVKALEEFNQIRNYHRDDPYAVKAELAIADLYFSKSEWDQARLAYEDFLRLHPRHEDVDYVVFRLGLTSWKKAPKIAARDQAWTRSAVNTWTGFDARFSESEYVLEVQEYLAEAEDRLAHKEFQVGRFYYKRGAWSAVIGRMEGLLSLYPECTDAPEALRMLAVARFEQGDVALAQDVARKLREDHPESRAVRRLERSHPMLAEGGMADQALVPQASPEAVLPEL